MQRVEDQVLVSVAARTVLDEVMHVVVNARRVLTHVKLEDLSVAHQAPVAQQPKNETEDAEETAEELPEKEEPLESLQQVCLLISVIHDLRFLLQPNCSIE